MRLNQTNSFNSPSLRKKKIPAVNSRSTNGKKQFFSRSVSTLIRVFLVWLVLVVGAVSLGWRLYHLQIEKGQEYKERAEFQQKYNFRPYIPRRSIIDANGTVVATDKLIYELYVHRIILSEEVTVVAQKLAQALPDQEVNNLIQLINSQDTGTLISRNINEDQAENIRSLKIGGVDLQRRYSRFYPQDGLAADIIGYVDLDHLGQAGLEYSQRNLLERDIENPEVRSMIQVSRDGKGAIIPATLPEGVGELDELSLKLTLDLRLQRAVRDRLKEQIDAYKAKKGAVIVLDAQTGGIVALACEPTYNPNRYSLYDFALFKNWSVTDSYEPGSTFKPINVAIALDEGVITPYSTVSDPAQVVIDGWPIANASRTGLGSVSLTRAMDVSSNTAMIDVMKRMGRERYYQRLQELGLNTITGVDLPFEAAGYLKSKEVFTARDIEMAVASFGQGLSLTPIKLVQLNAAIANGGKLITPHVVEGLVNAQGELEFTPELKTKRIFKESSAQAVVKMMESVVANGTGRVAHVDGYYVGGKTGTAQKHDGRGRYSPTARITSFVGIFPTDEPRYVILAVIDEPQGENIFGSTVTGPVVKDVIESLIAIKGIPPAYNFSSENN